MSKADNVKRGWRARLNGIELESVLLATLKQQGGEIIKIPSGGRFITKHKIVPVKSPFDFMLAHKGRAAYFDAKHTDGIRFPYSKVNQNQLSHLMALENQGMCAGYLIWSNGLKAYCFLWASHMKAMKPRSSLDLSLFMIDEICGLSLY